MNQVGGGGRTNIVVQLATSTLVKDSSARGGPQNHEVSQNEGIISEGPFSYKASEKVDSVRQPVEAPDDSTPTQLGYDSGGITFGEKKISESRKDLKSQQSHHRTKIDNDMHNP